MSISMIVAHGANREIGFNNQLLWKVKEDMQFFKRVTTGKMVVMGRKTFESIGRPLPNRTNIVLTRDHTYKPKGVNVVTDINTIFGLATTYDVFIIGGGEIYKTFLPFTDNLYVTEVVRNDGSEVEYDTTFPFYIDDFNLVMGSVAKLSETDNCFYNFNWYRHK